VVVLNLLDYLFTLRALDRGHTEANPVMATLFDLDPTFAGVFKMGVAFVIVGVVWELRHYRRVLQVSLVALGTVGAVVIYHLTMILLGV
jgi:hypothetical protein